jgi:hypothetical protein
LRASDLAVAAAAGSALFLLLEVLKPLANRVILASAARPEPASRQVTSAPS